MVVRFENMKEDKQSEEKKRTEKEDEIKTKQSTRKS